MLIVVKCIWYVNHGNTQALLIWCRSMYYENHVSITWVQINLQSTFKRVEVILKKRYLPSFPLSVLPWRSAFKLNCQVWSIKYKVYIKNTGCYVMHIHPAYSKITVVCITSSPLVKWDVFLADQLIFYVLIRTQTTALTRNNNIFINGVSPGQGMRKKYYFITLKTNW